MLDDSVIDDGQTIDHVLKDGIYFDLDEAVYHGLHRLSASGLKDMDISPSNYWHRSYHNPDKSDVTTPAMIVGKAAHTARLEPHKFHDLFVVEPSKDDFEQLLTTGPEIAAVLEKRGKPKNVAGEKVFDKAIRLKESGYGGNIWHLIKSDYEASRNGRDGISAAAMRSISKDAEILRRNPEVMQYLDGGAAEVSILWTDPENGLKFKCRIDYLKADSFTDIKNFANQSGKDLKDCTRDAFQYGRYHMQAVLYFRIIDDIRRGIISVDIIGEHTKGQAAIISSIKANLKPLDCIFIFMQKGGVPNILCRKIGLVYPIEGVLEQGIGADENALIMAYTKPVYSNLYFRAIGDIEAAISEYIVCSEVFIDGEPWQSTNMIQEIDDTDFAPFWLNKHEE